MGGTTQLLADVNAAAYVAATITADLTALGARRTNARAALATESRQLITWLNGLQPAIRRRWTTPIQTLSNNLIGGDQAAIDRAEDALTRSIQALTTANGAAGVTAVRQSK